MPKYNFLSFKKIGGFLKEIVFYCCAMLNKKYLYLKTKVTDLFMHFFDGSTSEKIDLLGLPAVFPSDCLPGDILLSK